MPRIDIPDGKSDPEVRMWKLRPEMGMGAGALSHAVYEQSIIPVRERELRTHAHRADQRLRDLPAVAQDDGLARGR